MKSKFFPLLFLLASPGALMAHEGHGTIPSSDAWHYIGEWMHGVPVLLLAIALVVLAVYMRRKPASEKRKS